MKINKAFYLLTFLILFCSAHAISQISKQNLSNIKVDELSDNQIVEYYEKLKKTGVDISSMENALLSKGMSSEEVSKLKSRISKLQLENQSSPNGSQYNFGESRRRSLTSEKKGKKDIVETEENFYQDSSAYKFEDAFKLLEKKIYGADLFSTENLTFEPNLNIPTPKNYQLGADDEVLIDVYGESEANYKLRVSPEGMIRIPLISPIYVGGLTIEDATKIITNRLSQIFGGMQEGRTNVNVTLGNIRSIKIIVMGEAKMPGTYTLPSLATVFNALYSCGGPSENGSFRNIQVIRNNKVISTIDIYEFLAKGLQKNNIRLEDFDAIKINPYVNRVSIFGEVKTPAYYEIIEKETFKDLLQYAGGFTDKAYSGIVKVLKNDKKERSIADIKQENFETYKPKNGDRFIVEKILEKFTNRLILRGAVYREGPYQLEDGLTLGKLIQKADGVRGDAFMDRGYIKRTREDYTTEFINFNLKNILNGIDKDISLMKDDEVNIPSSLELKEKYSIKVEGEVLHPGEFQYSENMNLADVILIAGGLKDAASTNRIEVARRIREERNGDDQKSEIFTFDLEPSLASGKDHKFSLKPFDVVYIRKSPYYQPQEKTTIEGEVLYPGNYSIRLKNSRVSDLIKRAGGLTTEAYPQGAVLVRRSELNKAQKEIAAQRLKKLAEDANDTLSSELKEITSTNEFVGIQLEKILKNPGSKYDLLLQEGDIIKIPRMLQTVRIIGEVNFPVSVRFTSGKRARHYVSQSGGFTERAKKSKLYVVNANGSVKSTSNFLFFLKYPKVYPGSEVIIPQKAPKKELTTQEILAVSSTLASLALVALTAINLLK